MNRPLFILCCLLATCLSLPAQETTYHNISSEAYPYGQPHPEMPEQFLDYHELIGTCDCTSLQRKPDQSWGEPQRIQWTFQYIMDGKGVQDATLKPDGKHSGSIRQFNADSTRWYVHYYSSASAPATLPSWGGERNGDEMILYRPQKAPNGMEGFYKIRFYDISDNGFKWLGVWTNENETFEFETWKIDCIKRRE